MAIIINTLVNIKGVRKMGKKILKEIISWVLVFVIAFAAAKFINRFVYSNVKVPSGSMENTIMTGDKVAMLRCNYLFSNPKRGDIVVFPWPDDETVDFIKRVIGLPGETIKGRNGLVYINGKPLKEPYVKANIDGDFGPYKIPKGCYFMMGDNRNDSDDSRFWNHPFLKREKIKGKAIFNYTIFKQVNGKTTFTPKFGWLNKKYF